MGKEIYRLLQKQLDQYSLGFPKTESGIEIDILKEMFTEEEAALFTSLTADLETAESIAKRIGKKAEEIAQKLEDMAMKGLLFRRRRGSITEYSAIPFIHGLVEFQINRLSKKTIKLVGRYIHEKFKSSLLDNVGAFMRTIPIQQSIDVEHHVASYEDAREILEKEELIVVTDCACRRQRAAFEKDCGKPMEVCFMFGPMGQYYIDNNFGRRIDLNEALEILEISQKAGLVSQPASASRPFTMCNCCGDCCGFLHSLNKHPKPAELVFSNYRAVVNPLKCSSCEICVERCQMNAATMNEDAILQITPDRCIGCGLCVVTCPENAIKLVLKSADERRIPARDTKDQMTHLAGKRGLETDDSSRIVSFGF